MRRVWLGRGGSGWCEKGGSRELMVWFGCERRGDEEGGGVVD